MDEAKVSIIIAAYNVERYIKRCIDSAREQTYADIEIIVVDDCSIDNTPKLCNELAVEDDRIIVIHHKTNLKLPATRNTGIDNSTGEYIVFLDGDDWLAPDYVEYMLMLIRKNNSDMAISRTNFTTRDTKQTSKDRIEVWDKEVATANFLYSTITIGAWNKIYNRSFIERYNLRFRPLYTAEGFRFISDCSQRVNHVTVGQRRVYYYRLNNPNSATTLPDIRQGLGAAEALDGIEKDLIIRTPLVMRSVRHHRWLNKIYTLQIIMENNSQMENHELYNDCIKYIRCNGWKVFREATNPQKKLKMFLQTLFPVVMTRVAIARKRRAFEKDKLYFDN